MAAEKDGGLRLSCSLALISSSWTANKRMAAEKALAASASLPLLFRPSASTSLRLGFLSALCFRPKLAAASLGSLSFTPNPRRRSCSAASASMSVEAPPASSPDLDGASRVPVLLFAKYQGLGNDFIMVDNRESAEPALSADQAVKMCDRNFGIGADGVIFVLPGVDGTDYSMRIFNSDGSEPEVIHSQGFRLRFSELNPMITDRKFRWISSLLNLLVASATVRLSESACSSGCNLALGSCDCLNGGAALGHTFDYTVNRRTQRRRCLNGGFRHLQLLRSGLIRIRYMK